MSLRDQDQAGRDPAGQDVLDGLVDLGQRAGLVAALKATFAVIPEATLAEFGEGARTVEEQAAALKAILGDNAPAVDRLLAGA